MLDSFGRSLHGLDLYASTIVAPSLSVGDIKGRSRLGQIVSSGDYVYFADCLAVPDTINPTYDARLRIFQTSPGPIDATVTSWVRPLGTDTLIAFPDTFAFVCPEADGDEVVIQIDVNMDHVPGPIEKEELGIGAPLSGAVSVFGSASGDSNTVLVGNTYRTTMTLSSLGGCGTDSIPITLSGLTIGFAPVAIRSPDFAGESGSDGSVNVVDLSSFSTHFQSAECGCKPSWPLPYDACFDYNMDDSVDVVDLSLWAFHSYDEYESAGGASLTYGQSGGSISISFEEEYPLVGSRKLYADVGLENVEAFSVLIVILRSNDPTLEFSRWTPDGEYPQRTAGVEITKNGEKRLMVFAKGGGTTGVTVHLGRLELNVNSSEPLTLTDEDFEPLLAEFATSATETNPQQVYRIVGTMVERSFETVRFRNQLAQNYPNPFNPTTTIAFSIEKAGLVDLKVYDVRGTLIRTLVSETRLPNNYHLVWDGRNNQGAEVATGVYFYRLQTSNFQSTRKMVLLH